MAVYVAMILHTVVEMFLLMATNRLCGFPPQLPRCLLGAVLGGLYGTVSLFPNFSFLNVPCWRLIGYYCTALVCFGISFSSLRRGAVFILLSMALMGVMALMGKGMVQAVAVLIMICIFADHVSIRRFIPVEISYHGKHMKMLALQDTGNTLRDPISGGQVLVVGADVASELFGISRQQLQSPIESMGDVPGMRLIPFHSVGKNRGMLLAMNLRNVKIGSWEGSSLVAFAPEGLCEDGTYQALTGGAIG